MIEFSLAQSGVVLEYQAEIRANGWIWQELQTSGHVQISRAFTFLRSDLLETPSTDDQEEIEGFTYRFTFATVEEGYYRIAGRIIGIDDDVLILTTGINLSRKVFVAERNISVFGRIAKLVGPGKEIVVGGDKDGAIPAEIFAEMLTKFPNSTELDKYASARVENVLGDYLDAQRDFRAQYEAYLNRRIATALGAPLRAEALLETEIEKFMLIRDTIHAWLATGAGRSEKAWQNMLTAFLLLIFPKYVAVLENVPVDDRYSSPGKLKKRVIDLALVDTNGSLDVIEIKRPFDDVLVRKVRYRDNSVPTKELSGTIMQAEKYLFHLSKCGVAGEEKLTEKYGKLLPPQVKIQITNPKALLILGRDRKPDGSPALDPSQTFDFEVIKRKYTNVMDIITYDDLLRRLESMISSLRRRSAEGLDATTP